MKNDAVNSPRTSAAGVDAAAITRALDAQGYARLPQVLEPAVCRALAEDFADDRLYRSTIDMARYNFGRGEYRYFAYPLPPPIEQLRTAWYAVLATIANQWECTQGRAPRFPADHMRYIETCHAAGQTRPTPLILRYATGDFNCLHQDLYGDEVFPLQVAILLSVPNHDFSGGEFVLTEQRPRMQSRAEVVPLEQGDAVVFPVARRPCQGTRGTYQVNMRHGVSRVHGGQRFTLGIIFHDAK